MPLNASETAVIDRSRAEMDAAIPRHGNDVNAAVADVRSRMRTRLGPSFGSRQDLATEFGIAHSVIVNSNDPAMRRLWMTAHDLAGRMIDVTLPTAASAAEPPASADATENDGETGEMKLAFYRALPSADTTTDAGASPVDGPSVRTPADVFSRIKGFRRHLLVHAYPALFGRFAADAQQDAQNAA